jgi:hypothetical protein
VRTGSRQARRDRKRCEGQQLFDQLDKTGKLTKRPAYRVRLEHDVFGLMYMVSNGSGAASMDGVDLPPNFCAPKTATGPAPKPTSTSTSTPQPQAQTNDAPPFDAKAAQAAVKGVDISKCKPLSGATKVVVTFVPDGSVSNVKTDNPCLATVYRSARVPAFSGSPVTVSVTAVQ